MMREPPRFDWPGLLFAAAITLAALLIMMR